jgi:flagellar operon protein
MVNDIQRVALSGVMETAVAAPGAPAPLPARAPAPGAGFDRLLQQAALEPAAPGEQPAGARVRFSAHAQQRLAQAAVQLGPQALAKLEAAVDKAGQKGGKESLILLDDLAFIVSIKNRTVITAVDAGRMAESVFTNIDSVVIARENGTSAPLGQAEA